MFGRITQCRSEKDWFACRITRCELSIYLFVLLGVVFAVNVGSMTHTHTHITETLRKMFNGNIKRHMLKNIVGYTWTCRVGDSVKFRNLELANQVSPDAPTNSSVAFVAMVLLYCESSVAWSVKSFQSDPQQ